MISQKSSLFLLSISLVMSSWISFVACDTPPNKSKLHTTFKKTKEIFTSNQWRAATFATAAATTAAISYGTDKIVGNGLAGDRFYNGKFAWGFAQSLKFSGVCFTVAPLLGEGAGSSVLRWGMRAPIVACLAAGVAHEKTQHLATYAPFGLGEHLSTYEKNKDTGEFKSKCGDDCKGICTRCFIPKSVLLVGIYKLADPLLSTAGTWIGNKLGLIDEDECDDY